MNVNDTPDVDADAKFMRLVLDTETRLETIEAVVRSLVRGTDEHTIDGKQARVALGSLERAEEDLRFLARSWVETHP